MIWSAPKLLIKAAITTATTAATPAVPKNSPDVTSPLKAITWSRLSQSVIHQDAASTSGTKSAIGKPAPALSTGLQYIYGAADRKPKVLTREAVDLMKASIVARPAELQR